MGKVINIGIIGGGVNGIGCAVAILRSLQNIKVTVYSEKFTPHTTGDGAGGLWGPSFISTTSEENLIKWSKLTFELFKTWWNEKREGISAVPVFSVNRDDVGIPYWSHVPADFEELNQHQLDNIGHGYTSGYSFSSFVAEPRLFLPNLVQEAESLGCKFENRFVRQLDDLSKHEDIIINCSGIGSRDLVPDPSVYPLRGQVMRVKYPSIKRCICDDSEDNNPFYIIPNTGSVVLGGTAQKNDWRTTIDPEDSKTIWKNCTALLPELKACQVLTEWVGLRPARENGIRLEVDEICTHPRKIPVVHNYGHGGSGVTLFWGCSLEVRDIVRTLINTNQVKLTSHY